MTAAILSFPKLAPRPKRARKAKPTAAAQAAAAAKVTDDRLRALSQEITRQMRTNNDTAAREGAALTPTERLAAMFRAGCRESAERLQACFTRWRDGMRTPAIAFCKASISGLATEHYGQGPDLYRFGMESVRSADVLQSSQRDEALALAIEQLNTFGVLARFGGLGHLMAIEQDKGGDYAAHTLADLGVTLARLRRFGAIAGPTPAEAKHAAQAMAAHHLDPGL